MKTQDRINSIQMALSQHYFWMYPNSIDAKIIEKATKEGLVNRISHTQAEWDEEGLKRLTDEA